MTIRSVPSVWPLTPLERALVTMAGSDPDDADEATATLEEIVDVLELHFRWRASL